MIAVIVFLGACALAALLHDAAWVLRWYIKRKEALKWPKLDRR